MKYCTHCGKELFDEAVMCPACGTMIAAPETPTEKPKERKPVDKKKVIRITIAAVAALLLVVGGVFGVIFVKNLIYAKSLESQLVGKTYEYANIEEDTFDFYMVDWLSFYEGGQYRCEYVTQSEDEVIEYTGEYSVKVGLDGVPELYLGGVANAMAVNDAGEIESITEGLRSYYPIEREDEERLADWFETFQRMLEKEQFQKALEENKQMALELFAGTSYWNTGDSFDNLIPIIFKDYDITCVPAGESNEEFLITVSGYYYINKVDLPNLTQPGELVCRVNVSPLDETVEVEEDSGIIDAMNLYVVLSTYGSYGW